jgi:hypothetical protein
MASENQLIVQSLGTALQTKKPSNGRSQYSDKSYISCMIRLFLHFSGTSPVNRITANANETERPAGTSTASVPKVHCPPLDLAFAPMTLVSDLLAQVQRTQIPRGKKGNYKITFPIKKARLLSYRQLCRGLFVEGVMFVVVRSLRFHSLHSQHTFRPWSVATELRWVVKLSSCCQLTHDLALCSNCPKA